MLTALCATYDLYGGETNRGGSTSNDIFEKKKQFTITNLPERN